MIVLFGNFYSLLFWQVQFYFQFINFFFRNLFFFNFNKKLNYLKKSIIMLRYFKYSINLYFFHYFLTQKHVFNFDKLKKRFINYWNFLWNFYFASNLMLITFKFLYMFLFKIKFWNKKYLFIRKRFKKNILWFKVIYTKLILNNKVNKKFYKLELVRGLYILYFNTYYFNNYYRLWHYQSFHIKLTNFISKRFLTIYNYNWLSTQVYFTMNLFFLKLINQFVFFHFNNFLYYKWRLFLIFFKLSSSLLTLVIPLRTSIVLFLKKRIFAPFLGKAFYKYNLLNSVYNHFLFFTFFNKLTTIRLSVNVVWIAVLVPKAYYTARVQFYYYYRKLFIYQKQITKYILNYYKFTVYELIKIQEFTLVRIILRSQFCFFTNFITLFYLNKFIFINFFPITSQYILVYPHDMISFVVSILFFLFYKWQILYIDLKFNRFLYYSRFWTLRMHRIFPKQNSFRLPHWVIFYRFFFFEIPLYLEVDFLILSIIVLNYYYSTLLFYYYFSFKEIPYTVVRNHNWKLLT